MPKTANQWEFGVPDGRHLKTIHGLITTPEFSLTRERLEQMEQVIVVSAYGTGYDYIDVDAASNFGILVTRTPDAVVSATAELGLTFIMALMRQIVPHDVAMRAHSGLIPVPLAHDAHHQVVGIIGYGRIGRELAKLLKPIGFDIMYTREHGPWHDHPGFVGISDLLVSADFVVVATPLTRRTRHLIGKDALQRMKPTAYLINIGRGACVDEEALVRVLQVDGIAGAALDVFEDEPRITEGLESLPNVILSPHVGTRTWETRARMTRDAFDNIEAGLKGFADDGKAVNMESWARRPVSGWV